jgi:signal transduction histidine kinase
MELSLDQDKLADMALSLAKSMVRPAHLRMPEFMRTTTFRWTLVVSGALAACILLMFGFVYWQTADYMNASIDHLVMDRADTIAAAPQDRRTQEVKDHLGEDPRRVKLAGLFDADGKRIAGNIVSLPEGLRTDDRPQQLSVMRVDPMGHELQIARIAARRLGDGDTLIIARNTDEMSQFTNIVERALALGLIPALCLAIAAGTILSVRAQKRVEEVNRRVRRIVDGELRQRLPTRGVDDSFDRLAIIVNGMLDEIESLVQSMAGVGDDIAHDLRTPLTRVRVRLDRCRQNARTAEQLRGAIDQAIVGLDQSLAMVTALLRISEIEHSRRLAGFSEVLLAEVVREVGNLYEPIAEDKQIALTVQANEEILIRGDRDLLFEAIANLVDNAVKFTPLGGRVELSLARGSAEAIVRVRDSGPGIAEAERDLVGRRFYRSDKSRSEPGLGLGLSLVNAVAKLHGFRFNISAGPGCIAELAGPVG